MIRRKYISLCIATLMVLWAFSLNAESKVPGVVVLDESTVQINLLKQMEILEDPEGILNFQDVSSGEASKKFVRNKDGQANFGQTDSVFWVRLTLDCKVKRIPHFDIVHNHQRMEQIEFYQPDASGSYHMIKGGLNVPVSERVAPGYQHVFSIHNILDGPQTYYFKFKSHTVMLLGLSVWTPHAFVDYLSKSNLLIGIVLGVMVFLAIYNLLLFVSIKDRNYLYLVVTIIFYTLYDASLSGIAHEFLWPSASWFAFHSPVLLSGFVVASGSLFVRSFLDTPDTMPRFDKLFIAYIVLGPLCSLAGVFDYRTGNYLTSIVGLTFFISIAYSSIYLYLKGFKPARFIILAFGFFLFFSAAFVLNILDIIRLNHLGFQYMHMSFALAGVLLSFALADRINHVQSIYQNALKRTVADKTRDLRSTIRSLNQEISQRQYAEKELAGSEKRYRELVEFSTHLIYKTDKAGNFIYANPSFSELTGYSRQEIVEMNYAAFIDDSEREEAVEFYKKQYKERIEHTFREVLVRCKDGHKVTVLQNVLLLLDDDKPVGFQIIGLDVTEHKRAEERQKQMEIKLQQQQKLESVGTLAAGVAHEINNPMQIIMNLSELILDEVEPAGEVGSYAALIKSETFRVSEIVGDLLTFSRQDTQKPSPAALSDIIKTTVSLVKPLMKKDQTVLNLDLEKNLPFVRVRSRQIMQVLMNLLANAREALNDEYGKVHDDNKIIKVKAARIKKDGRDFVRVSVSDHGPGVDESIVGRIFDPFFSSKPRDKAGGLGLSVSHGIVKDHGGDLSYERNPEGLTCFHMDLPLDHES